MPASGGFALQRGLERRRAVDVPLWQQGRAHANCSQRIGASGVADRLADQGNQKFAVTRNRSRVCHNLPHRRRLRLHREHNHDDGSHAGRSDYQRSEKW